MTRINLELNILSSSPEMGYYGKRLHKQQTQTTSTTHDPYHHDSDSRPKRRRHQRRRATHPLSTNRQFNLSTGVSHDTLILGATRLLPHTDARPLYSKRQEI